MVSSDHANGETAQAVDYRRFFVEFFKAKGAPEIFFLSILFSLGIGSTIGLIPDTLADRYARLRYDFQGDHCSSFDRLDKPDECQEGSDDAQAAAAWSNVAVSVAALVCNPVVGSISDTVGRRYMILACFLLSCIPALVFFVTIHVPTVDPFWFYVSNSLLGAINYMSITFAALSDVVPDNYRAPAYGFLLAGFYAGFALSPSLPLCLTAEHVAALSFGLILATLLIATIVLPETLPDQIRQENMAAREQSRQETASVSSSSSSFAAWTWAAVTRPVREVAILNRDWLIRLVAAGSFFSSAVFASDATLVLYYIEDQLNVRETDLARMFFLMGIFGVVLQGGFLQPMLQCFGEKGLLVATFCSGILHNFLYGVATNKTTLCVAMLLSQLTKMNFPLLSSLASKDASTNEQGRVQGALFATNAIAYAVGPLSMEYVYHRTKNKKHFGPGFMFVYAAGLYAIGTLLVALIPIKKSPEVSSSEEQQPGICGATEDLEEPLLSSDGEVNGETEGPCLTETIE